MSLDIPDKKRTPDRNRGSANVAVPWAVYDRLDALAAKHNSSIASVINALLEKHETL